MPCPRHSGQRFYWINRPLCGSHPCRGILYRNSALVRQSLNREFFSILALRLELRDPSCGTAATGPGLARFWITVFYSSRSGGFLTASETDEVGNGHSKGSRPGFH